ncbi:MAG: HupE/UreJ family protein [Rhizobiaceae bacterium]|jgi:urease accessory protein|nr:HupE/UreJ family protein [Rhizobiaceae bacterium]
MTRSRLFVPAFVAPLALVAPAALAHTGHADTGGFVHGFLHPVGGLDHVLAMVMVGLLAAAMGGRALVALPVVFVSMMAVGGLAGMSGMALPGLEAGIALSVVVLGSFLAFPATSAALAAVALTGAFAVFHGFAHGAEMPVDTSGAAYAAGFLIATAILHGVGIAAGVTLNRFGGRMVSRAAGAAGALAGVALLGGMI